MNRKAITMLVKLLVAGGLIAWVIHNAGWDNITSALTNIDRGGVTYGVAIMLVANVIAMLRWHMLMRSVKLDSTAWGAVRLGFIGLFFNNVMPGLTGGDIVKAIYLTREHPKQRTGAVVSVVVDRIIGIIALTLIAAVVIPFDLDRYAGAALPTYGFLLAAIVGSIAVLSRRVKSRLRDLVRLLRRNDGSNEGAEPKGRIGRLARSITSVMGKIDDAVSTYRHQARAITVAMLLSLVVQLLLIYGLMVFGDALADGGRQLLASAPPTMEAAEVAQRSSELDAMHALTFGDYCSVVPIINIVTAVPISPPSGWGMGEALFQYFFSTLGVAKGDSVALSFTYRITNLLISLLGGVALLFDRRRVLAAAHETDVEATP